MALRMRFLQLVLTLQQTTSRAECNVKQMVCMDRGAARHLVASHHGAVPTPTRQNIQSRSRRCQNGTRDSILPIPYCESKI